MVVFDNLSRAETLKKADNKSILYNWNYLKSNYKSIVLIKGDVRKKSEIEKAALYADLIVHAAAQVAVTSSIENPRTDFEINVLGTFNVLEAARRLKSDPAIIYCSTNKVYGENVNKIPVLEKETRYTFADKKFECGIPETFPIDFTRHTPYGCSKVAGDLYMQDYNKMYGLDTCVFRMSCVYGIRQFGNEDQGWIAHFIISVLGNKSLSIYGDGKQVRDILYVSDLVEAFNSFFKNRQRVSGEVFNIGGGPSNTISLLELLNFLEKFTGKSTKNAIKDWRPSDQKVYISNISKINAKMKWKPRIEALDGIRTVVTWLQANLPSMHT